MNDTNSVNEFRIWQTYFPLFIGIVVIIAIVSIGIYMSLDARRQAGLIARQFTDSLVRVLERDIARNIEVLDLSLQAVIEGVVRPDIMSAKSELRNMILFDRSTAASGVGSLRVIDRNGRVVIDSRNEHSASADEFLSRDFFNAQINSDRGLYISRIFKSGSSSVNVIGLSRRINNLDGTFGGIALATIETSYLTELIARLHLGDNAVVTLVRDDGLALLRQMAGRIETNVDLSAVPAFLANRDRNPGFYIGPSKYDMIERIYSFHQIENYPIKIAIGFSTKSAYSDWLKKTYLLSFILFISVFIIVILLFIMNKDLKLLYKMRKELSYKNFELERMALTDPLTGIGNRRYFDQSVEREIRRCRRIGSTFVLLLIDIDEFKAFNDRYGHAEGDKSLILVAHTIRDSLRRPGDMVFRVGGEEIAVVLSDANELGGINVANRIIEGVRNLEREHTASKIGKLTVSIGLAQFSGESAKELYVRADIALYEVKRSGRNNFIINYN